MQNLLLKQALFYTDLKLLRATETVSHGAEAYVESQTNHELALADVATTLNNVLRLDLERCRIIDLLEITREVALMIVLPLD